MTQDVRGRVALVTGSTRGVGEAVARRLAAAGMNVVITGRNAEAGAALVTEIAAAGGVAHYVSMDISVEPQVEAAMAAAAAEFGGLDVLVNNAAPTDHIMAGVDKRITELSTADLESMLVPGLYGQFWAIKYALPYLAVGGHGSIINISSMGSVVGLPRMPAYSMSKGALNALSRQVAVDYAGDGVRSNTIVIGYALSPPVASVVMAHPVVGPALREASLTPPGTPEDVAEAALFLASDSSRYITGSDVNLDGGLLASRNLPDIPSAFAPPAPDAAEVAAPAEVSAEAVTDVTADIAGPA
jgi:NAD(P)-dependent dehydrogenase (short-subunit alcohol dehydrogenase family)